MCPDTVLRPLHKFLFNPHKIPTSHLSSPIFLDDETEAGVSRNRSKITQQRSGGVGFEPVRPWSLKHNSKVTSLRAASWLSNQFPSPSAPRPSSYPAPPSCPFVSVTAQIRLLIYLLPPNETQKGDTQAEGRGARSSRSNQGISVLPGGRRPCPVKCYVTCWSPVYKL